MKFIKDKKFLGTIVSLLIISLAYGYLAMDAGKTDPDRFYHLRLAQITADQGIQDTLPQADDIGWGEKFPDKEFLFHMVTAAFYSIGGMRAVEFLPIVMLAMVIIILVIIQFSLLPSWWVLIMTLFGLLCNSHFVFRMCLLRPHLLAIVIFCLMLYACLYRRRMAFILCCFVFSLAYHAIYVPFLVICVYGFCSSIDKGWVELKYTVYSTLALIAGIVLSPYFPDNFIMTVQHLKIAAGLVEINKMLFGGELHLRDSKSQFLNFGFLYLSVVGQLMAYVKVMNSDDRENLYKRSVLILISVAFAALTFFSPRANEYAFPTCLVGLAFAMPVLCSLHKYAKLVVISSMLFFAVYNIKELDHIRSLNPQLDGRFEVIGKIPDDEGKKVYNCSWSESPYIYYKRPDLKWVDLLDPSFLHQKNNELFNLRQELNSGEVADMYLTLRKAFNSDYAFCHSRIFDRDPNLIRLYPKTLSESIRTQFNLYLVPKKRRPEQVLRFKYVKLNDVMSENLMDMNEPPAMVDFLEWPDPEYFKEGESDLTPAFIQFRLHYPALDFDKDEKGNKIEFDSTEVADRKKLYDKREEFSSHMHCFAVSPKQEELERLLGSTIMTVAGGQHIRVWLNGKKLYSTDVIFAKTVPFRKTLQLEKPISRNDDIKAVVCSFVGDGAGFMMGLWKYDALYEVCQNRKSPLNWQSEAYDKWPGVKFKYVECLNR